MKLDEIIKLNEKFNTWDAEYTKERELRLSKLYDLNDAISLDEIRTLGYKDAKEIFENIQYNLNEEKKKALFSLIKELQLEEYPILKMAHYYPVINEMDFLTDVQKNKLDNVLMTFAKCYVMTGSGAWYDLGFSKELTEKVLSFLYGKGMLKKYYVVYCECGNERRFIGEDEYNRFQRYYELEKMLYNGEIDENSKEYEEYDNLFEELKFEIGCFECEGREITCMKDIDDHFTLQYKNIALPDLTYD